MNVVRTTRVLGRVGLAALRLLLPLTLAIVLRAQTEHQQARPKAPEGAAARFATAAGETKWITDVQVAQAFATRDFGTPNGRKALDHLITVELVELEAASQGVKTSELDVRRRLEEMRVTFQRSGRSLESFLLETGYTRELFIERILAPSIAHERLVMRALDLKDRREITPELLELWVKEARERHQVVTDPAVLGPDLAVRIDDRNVSRIELGRMMARTAGPEKRRRTIETLILQRLIDERAKAAGIEVGLEDARASVEEKKRSARARKEFEGIPFEQLLATQGMTVEGFVRSPTLRAQIQEERLIDRTWTDDALTTYIAANADAVRAAHGPRRRLRVLLLLATERPNSIVKRSFDTAVEEAEALRQRAGPTEDGFALVARVSSDEPGSKVEGGAIGWHARASAILPDKMLAAAWKLPRGGITEPIRGERGVWLIRVDAIEPEPNAETLRERVRFGRRAAWRRELLESAKIEIFGD